MESIKLNQLFGRNNVLGWIMKNKKTNKYLVQNSNDMALFEEDLELEEFELVRKLTLVNGVVYELKDNGKSDYAIDEEFTLEEALLYISDCFK